MASVDLWIANYLRTIFLPGIFFLIVFAIVIKKAPFITNWIRAHFYAVILSESLMEASNPFKKQLFSELHNLESKDWQLKNKGLIRILEIGVGPGCNFNFYPKNCHVLCYDPNPYFRDYIFQNYGKNPDFILERFVVAPGEDLVGVEDGTVDAVITTFVLCSVEDVKVVLSEIKRVLAPGGKYFFMEHQRAQAGHWSYLFQKSINPVWHMFIGCDLRRPLCQLIENMDEFHETEIKEFVLFHTFPVKHLLGSVIMGSTCLDPSSK